MEGPVTVTQFNERVSAALSGSPALNDVAVVGEISEFKIAASGHCYPTLRDGASTLKCAFFRSYLSRLTFRPQVGMKVVAYGSASYYAPSGSLSFKVVSMAPYGKGERQAALEELAARLLKEGLFDPERKRPLPRYPKVVGVVTSAAGAAIKDIVDTMGRRFPADVLLAPARVQGEGAAESIARGIRLLNSRKVDVIIVGRGGGSREDLSAFDSEAVVRAIAESAAPVISAVGHATDKSLSDRAADRYAETPTAAAALAVRDAGAEADGLSALSARMGRALSSLLESKRQRFARLDAMLSPRGALEALRRRSAAVDALAARSDAAAGAGAARRRMAFQRLDAALDVRRLADRVCGAMRRVDELSEDADAAAARGLAALGAELDAASRVLAGLDPENVLSRGYCMLSLGDGRVAASAAQLSPGDAVRIRLWDGAASAAIEEVSIDERRRRC